MSPKILSVRISDKQQTHLQRRAFRHSMTVSELAREMIDQTMPERRDVVTEILDRQPDLQRQPIHIGWWRQQMAPLGVRGQKVR